MRQAATPLLEGDESPSVVVSCSTIDTHGLEPTDRPRTPPPARSPSVSPRPEPEQPRSANVPRMFAYNFLDGAAFSVWQFTVLQQFLYTIAGKSNKTVGFVSGASGVAQVLSAIAGSAVADKVAPRHFVCKAGAAVACVGIALGVWATHDRSIVWWYVGSVLWGAYTGLANPASEALFADSVPQTRRAAIYTYKWMVQVLCYLVGFVLTIVMFWRIGDHWGLGPMTTVLYAGLGSHALALVVLCTLSDRHALPKAADAEVDEEDLTVSDDSDDGAAAPEGNLNADPEPATSASAATLPPGSPASPESAVAIPDGSPLRGASQFSHRRPPHDDSLSAIGRGSTTVSVAEAAAAEGSPTSRKSDPHTDGADAGVVEQGTAGLEDGEDEEEEDPLDTRSRVLPWLRMRHVPYFVAASDTLLSLGSGMTMRFIPMFFINDHGLTPVLMTAISCGVTLATTGAAAGLKVAAAKVFRNRCLAILAVRVLGSLLLMFLGLARGQLAQTAVLVAVFVCRMACMNSTFGISRSVIMDLVPTSQRARWSALESFTGFTWAASAAVGGVLSDAYGYQTTFVVTATVHLVASSFLVPATMALNERALAAKAEAEKDK